MKVLNTHLSTLPQRCRKKQPGDMLDRWQVRWHMDLDLQHAEAHRTLTLKT